MIINTKRNIHQKRTKNLLNKLLLPVILALKIFTISNLHQNLIYNHLDNQIFKAFIQNSKINNFKNLADNHNFN